MSLDRFNRMILKVVDLVNRRRPLSARTREVMAPRKIRENLLTSARTIAERGWVAGPLGEASLRLPGGKVLITAKDSHLYSLAEEDLLVVPISGDYGSDASKHPRHMVWHREIYRSTRADAVLLCQPVSATVFATLGTLPDKRLLLDALEFSGELRLLDPLSSDHALTFNADEGLLLLRGYGVLAWGFDIEALLGVIGLLEQWCTMTLALKRFESRS